MNERPPNWKLKYERKPKETLWSALLAARKIEDPGTFFNTVGLENLHDPFAFVDMRKAVDRLEKAIQSKERIVVYGDYDVDGTSGAALLIHTLKKLGAVVSYRVPHRLTEGYGLHAHHVEELATQHVKVLITVDLGISAAKEIQLANEKGIDVLVTDHHAIPQNLPKAYAILHPKVDPNYPFKELSGSGVAFKLASALLQSAQQEEELLHLVDLASLGTVADCVPLEGENRTLVKLGLHQLKKTKWEGLKAILKGTGLSERLNQEWDTDVIGFQIGPRINAAGRMDTPYWALQTLLAEDPEEAHRKGFKLEQLNQERQALTQKIQEEVELDLQAQPHADQQIIIAAGKGWSSGLVGLIAGRLQEKYKKPVFLMEDQGETLTGSVRATPGFSAVEALKYAEEALEKFGGHEMAGGFHLRKASYELLLEKLNAFAQERADENGGALRVPMVEIDAHLHPDDLSIDLLSKLSMFAPFGVGNPKPLFLAEGVTLKNLRILGSTGKHLKAEWTWQGKILETLAFNVADKQEEWRHAQHLLLTPEITEWKGQPQMIFHVKAWA